MPNIIDPVTEPSVLREPSFCMDELDFDALSSPLLQLQGKVDKKPQTAAIILAGGTGERFGKEGGKQLVEIAGKPILTWSAEAFDAVGDVGLIVIDEEHEGSYKQDSSPRYHARDVAEWMMARAGGALVLGSATPSIEALYQVNKNPRWTAAALPERANGRPMPAIEVVDMAAEFASGSRAMFSGRLARALGEELAQGRKAVLLLNQRGFAKFLLCRDCGFVPECPHCSTSLTYHEQGAKLVCHHCGYRQRVDDRCPVCGGELRFLGDGTERIEADLHALFPGVETLRMVADGQAEALEFIVRAESQFLDVPLKALKLKDSVLVASIIRRGKCRVPSGNDAIELGDRVVVVTTNHGMHELKDILK